MTHENSAILVFVYSVAKYCTASAWVMHLNELRDILQASAMQVGLIGALRTAAQRDPPEKA
jgi:hypothetical protein